MFKSAGDIARPFKPIRRTVDRPSIPRSAARRRAPTIWCATYLAPDESTFVTGAGLLVNGGATAW